MNSFTELFLKNKILLPAETEQLVMNKDLYKNYEEWFHACYGLMLAKFISSQEKSQFPGTFFKFETHFLANDLSDNHPIRLIHNLNLIFGSFLELINVTRYGIQNIISSLKKLEQIWDIVKGEEENKFIENWKIVKPNLNKTLQEDGGEAFKDYSFAQNPQIRKITFEHFYNLIMNMKKIQIGKIQKSLETLKDYNVPFVEDS